MDLRVKIAFDFTRAMFTIAKYNDGLYNSPAQGRTALEYVKNNNDHPDESEAWAKRIPGYNRKQMRHIAIVDRRFNRIYYFLLDRAGVVSWASSKLRKDGVLPKPRKQNYIRPDLNDLDASIPDAMSGSGPVIGDVVEGSYELDAKVLSTKMQNGTLHTLLEVVKDGVQFKLWGPVPLDKDSFSRGEKVKFKADVVRKRGDTTFGFFTPIYDSKSDVGFVENGTYSIKGVIEAVFDSANDWGYQTKMVVTSKDSNGNKIEVEGTVPASILRRYDDKDLEGKFISFEAQFVRSRKAPNKGYFKRPKQVEIDSAQALALNKKLNLTVDMKEALSELVMMNPFDSYLESPYEDGIISATRKAGKVSISWDKLVEAGETRWDDKWDQLLNEVEMEDTAFIKYVKDLYDRKIIYKADLKSLLNFEALYKRSPRRDIDFKDRNGVSHKVAVTVVSYPEYTLTIDDDENPPRVFPVGSLIY